MEIIELTKKEFDNYATNHPLGSFQQTSFWGRFMECDNYHAYYVGGFIKDNIIGASLLLSFENKKKQRIFYAPRGFLVDYKNEELLLKFTEKIKEFIISKKGVYLKIDPYVLTKDRDASGLVIEGGVNNDFIITNILHAGFTKSDDSIQPNWLSRINLKGKKIDDIFNNFSLKARQIIRKNNKLGFMVRDLDFKDIDKFLNIINNESKKYNTIVPTIEFYKDLKQTFNDKVNFKEVYFKKNIVLDNIDKEIASILEEKKNRIINYHKTDMTEKYFIDKELVDKFEIERLNKLKDYFSSCDEVVSMGCFLFITVGNEIVAFQGGMLDEFSKLNASYTLHYEMIKYALEHNYSYYNLYEIGDITNKSNKLLSSFNYKKNFGGEVLELIGEFDLIIDSKYKGNKKQDFSNYLGVKTSFK